MKYTYHEIPEEKNGVISNTHGFLYRHLDTGFSTKWDGFWVPPYKMLDYFSFKVNGIWLDRETLQGVEYGDKMVFHHETDSLEVKETVETPDGSPGFRVILEIKNRTESRKAVQTVLETGIDIRSKDEDIGSGEYSLERDNNILIASRNGRKITVEPEEPEGFRGEAYEKEHYPGERQSCLVPERPVFREEIEPGESEKVSAEFRTSDGAFYEVESPDNCLNHELGRLFNYSISSLENLIYARNGTGIIAGHPWFQSYWARDSFWSLLGLIDAGYFETSRKILENFVSEELDGKIELDDNTSERIERADTAPLFVIAADKLRRHDRVSEAIEKGIEEAMKMLETDEDGLVKHSKDGTWMDTLERDKAVDIQSLWLRAARITDDPREEELKRGLDMFVEDGELLDELEGGSDTINPAVPLMFGQFDGEEVSEQLEKINGEFSSRYGARTRSVTDPGYDAAGYHTGSVWGLTTCWAAAANMQYGRDRQGINFLEKLSEFLDRDQPGALPEVVNAESGELMGAPEQAWSAGMLVHVVDSYLLGIEIHDDHVSIDPVEDLSCERKGKRINEEVVDISVEDGEVEILNDPDLELRF